MRPAGPALAAALLLGAGAAAAGPIHDRIYQPPHQAPPAPAGLSPVTVETRDGLALVGLERAPAPGRPTLLVFHGNASCAAQSAEWLRPLLDAGYGMVAAEYRGYCANPGRPDERGLADDADAFLAEARRLAAGGRVVVFGHSLGAAVALALARRSPVPVVAVGAFTRLADLAPAYARPFLRERYDDLQAVAGLRRPLFLVQGDRDEVVAPSALARLAAAARTAGVQGAAFVVEGAAHQPDGAVTARIVTLAVARLDRTDLAAAPPPPGVQVLDLQPPAGNPPLPAHGS